MLEGIYRRLAEASRRPRILCGDLNTPREEAIDGTVTTWRGPPGLGERWIRAERNVLVGLGDYDLGDVYRRLHGYAKEDLSHYSRGRGRRYDHVFASSDLRAQSACYLHELRESGLSDHSAIEVVFKRRGWPVDGPSRPPRVLLDERVAEVDRANGLSSTVVTTPGVPSALDSRLGGESCAFLPGETMATVERAIQIAVEAHAGQTDKGGAPYLLHPLRVMLRVESPEARIAAVLHDVVEDGLHKGWTLERLRSEGFSESVLSAVACLTKSDGEDYDAFIERVAANPVATQVKIADLSENMDLTRLGREPMPKDIGGGSTSTRSPGSRNPSGPEDHAVNRRIRLRDDRSATVRQILDVSLNEKGALASSPGADLRTKRLRIST